ncbi:unnamed protein product [Hymenolepis diminuta]|uniref:Protein Dr1 n=1 Tax=Hymenolepis diminuta TaxID=6216 RepID=A0A0R3SYV3_HYMDI|nr:unnamed protein product [Hymenolepis diminuta]VUZ44641.1 unnamed protein product [Hymenolepis diminuta]
MEIDDNLAFKEDEEVAIPRASLNKFIKEFLPEARLSIETRDLVLNCCHKFIHQLSSEANAACARANKKTINPEHILSGLESMGLSDYVAEVRAANEGAKVELKDRRMLSASHRFKKQDPEEWDRLGEEQERLFELARVQMLQEQQQLMGESDLLKAAESTMHVVTGCNQDVSSLPSTSDGNSKPNGDNFATATASIPASALLLGGVVDKDDEYD